MTEAPDQEAWRPSDTELFARYGDAFVPRRREQMDTVCELLGGIPEPAVLDLCCGEGRLAEEYLSRSPGGRVTLLDGSEEMLEKAARRLASYGDRCTRLRADIEDRSWRREAAYGGVMTSLAVHHLDGPGKQALYRDVHAMLVPGGVFVMADLMEPAGPAGRAVAAGHWDRAVLRASREQFGGDEAVEACERAEWNYYRLPGPDPVDRPSSVVEHLDWLREAGFAEVDLVWMYAGHAVITAKRRPAS
jgi:tRNA (cmo5U34)-methyltransferase